MIQLVDVKQKLGVALSNRRKTLVLFIISTIFIIGFDAILIATSSANYVVEAILTILFTILYLFFLIFYFTILRKNIINELNFYSDVDKAELNEIRVQLIDFSEETKINNGLEYFVLKAIVKNRLEDVEQLFLVPNKFTFKKNEKAILKTFGRVVIEVGESK